MEKEMELAREPEPLETSYDQGLLMSIEKAKKRREGKVLIRGRDVPWQLNRNGVGKYYSTRVNWDQMGAPGLHVSHINMQNYRRGKHTHRGGGRLLFCLEGRGRTINNDVALDWEKGDLELLPVTRTENVHQHINLDMGKPCGLMVLMFGPFLDCIANEARQIIDAPDWKGAKKEELYRRDDFLTQQDYLEGYPIQINKPTTLLDNLYLRRNLWREKMSKARWIIKQKDQPQELNRLGFYRWYIHPSFDDVAYKAMLFWTHEIPPGSRSGKQKFQGGRLHFILEGHGYSMVNGVRYDWESEDVLIPPIIGGGVVVQHFNGDPFNPVKMACAEPNWYEILGMDMACGFEQIEDCPEWQALSKSQAQISAAQQKGGKQ